MRCGNLFVSQVFCRAEHIVVRPGCALDCHQLASLVMVLDFTAPRPLDALSEMAVLEEVGHLVDSSRLLEWCTGQSPSPPVLSRVMFHLRGLVDSDRELGPDAVHPSLPALGMRRLPLDSPQYTGRCEQFVPPEPPGMVHQLFSSCSHVLM